MTDGEDRLPPETAAQIYEGFMKDVIYAGYYGPCCVILCVTVLRNGLQSAAYDAALLRMASNFLKNAYGGCRLPDGVDSAVAQDVVMLLPLAKLAARSQRGNMRAIQAALKTAQGMASAQVSNCPYVAVRSAPGSQL